MGSSPIARSIFFKNFLFSLLRTAFFFLPPFALFGQITTDPARPFDQGRVVPLPGYQEYLGDLPEDVEWLSNPVPFHSLAGLLAPQVGWTGPGSPPLGINNSSPGVLFEGVPYPFKSNSISNWLPINGDLELLDFPASAWWGPSAARGAIQIGPTDLPDAQEGGVGLWGGSGGMGGGEGSFQDPDFLLDGKIQHELANDHTPLDAVNLLSGMTWLRGNPVKIKTDFLGSQWFGGNDWYCLVTSLEWDSPNFQSLEWKPFFQSARSNGIELQELGNDINYHFNMAGVAESQIGIGFFHDDYSPGGGPSSNNEYVQNSETFDVLGPLVLNAAIRWDFSSREDTFFSTVLGAQYLLSDFLFLGNYAKAVDPLTSSDTRQGELGFRYQPNEDFSTICLYVHEQLGGDSWEGAKLGLQGSLGDAISFLRKVMLEAQEQVLADPGGNAVYDTGGWVQWAAWIPLKFWVGGRVVSGQPLYSEGGCLWQAQRGLEIFVSIENIGNIPISWPDPTTPAGQVFWSGAKIGL